MIFRQIPKSYSITLKRAHSLLRIPRNSTTTPSSVGIGGVPNNGSNATTIKNIPSRSEIQEAFRLAAKRHHPDLLAKQQQRRGITEDANKLFRECAEARELLLDHYIKRNKSIHPEIIESTKDHPVEWNTNQNQHDGSFIHSFMSVWNTNSRSFRMEALLRLSACLALAIGTFYHDKYLPERRRRQIQRRDAMFEKFGPSPPRF